MPDKTHKLKGDTSNKGKMFTVRIMVMICKKASGSEKQKLLIIRNF